MMTKFCLMALLLVCLTGCASVPAGTRNTDDWGALQFATREARNTQLGITALIALDTAQTVTIARNPDCLREGNRLATLAFGGDDSPSQQRVLLTNLVAMTLHWWGASFLDRKANTFDVDGGHRKWQVMQRIYQGLTIVGHGSAVLSNNNLGIRPFSNYNCM